MISVSDRIEIFEKFNPRKQKIGQFITFKTLDVTMTVAELLYNIFSAIYFYMDNNSAAATDFKKMLAQNIEYASSPATFNYIFSHTPLHAMHYFNLSIMSEDLPIILNFNNSITNRVISITLDFAEYIVGLSKEGSCHA